MAPLADSAMAVLELGPEWGGLGRRGGVRAGGGGRGRLRSGGKQEEVPDAACFEVDVGFTPPVGQVEVGLLPAGDGRLEGL